MLTKALVQIGDSVGIIVDKPLLQSLELKKGDVVGVALRGDEIVISRLKKQTKATAVRSRSARLAAVRDELHANLGSAFRKLAK